MPDTLSFAEIDGQHVELLPVRTVLSLFSADGHNGGGIFNWLSDALTHQANSAGNGVGGAAGSANGGDAGGLRS